MTTQKKKVMSWLFATDVPLLTLCWKRIDFLFGSVRYQINISVFVMNVTIMFEPLLFHIPTGFAHNSEHAGGLRGFSTDR